MEALLRKEKWKEDEIDRKPRGRGRRELSQQHVSVRNR